MPRRLVPLAALALVVLTGACGRSSDASVPTSSSATPTTEPAEPTTVATTAAPLLAATTTTLSPDAHEITLLASSAGLVPQAITLTAGEPVVLRLHSLDGLHVLESQDLGVYLAADEGEWSSATFTAPAVGAPATFTLTCVVSGEYGVKTDVVVVPATPSG